MGAPTFRQTTVAAVSRYRRRHRYLKLDNRFVEIARITRDQFGYLVYLAGSSEYLSVPSYYPAWVHEGPCRRERRAS